MFTKLKKSNKRMLFLLMSAIIALPIWSKPINENTALGIATQKLLHSSGLRSSKNSTAQESLQLLYKSSSIDNNSGNTNSSLRVLQANETVYFYVFGTEKNDGFVIVSGDDRVVPILSYSDTNGFFADDMPSKYNLPLITTLSQQLKLRSNGRNILVLTIMERRNKL